VRIWCAFALIPSFAAVVPWLGDASSDAFGDPACCIFHNLVRGLHGDQTPLQLVELLLSCEVLVGPGQGA
jgi:hypothetical protein